MTAQRRGGRAGRAAALVLVATLLPACEFDLEGFVLYVLCAVNTDTDCDDAGAKPELRAANPAAAREFTFYADPAGPFPNGRRTRVPVEQIPPFRFEFTIGLCDPAFAPDAGASFGASAVESAGGTGRWTVSCRNAGGLEVTPQFGTATVRMFPNAARVDVAFQHDGSQIIAFVRDPEASPVWQELARETLGTTTGVFLPELFARDFQAGAMTSCYALKFVSNGASAPGASPQREATRQIADATTPLLAAKGMLHGLDADATAAATQFDMVKVRIDGAIASLALVPPGAGKTAAEAALAKAMKSLARASKRVAKAASLLRRKGLAKAASADKQIAKAAKDLAAAFDGVLPDDLRAAVGDLRLRDVLAR